MDCIADLLNILNGILAHLRVMNDRHGTYNICVDISPILVNHMS